MVRRDDIGVCGNLFDLALAGIGPGVARIASVVFGPQLAHHGAGLPHLALAHLTQLFVELLAVVGLAVEVDRTLGLVAGGDFAVKLLEDGFRGVAETFPPIQRAALGRGRAVGAADLFRGSREIFCRDKT